ncbi:G-type lectin S-receptor-like serine/threonine-protein kinase RLK1 [Lycium ferocissimum]|uniref:G-type lectin S-receptor-like serine/threonine-protein kinase RLK1 n=1 Tax=Lycium ferocissimum TaxID=112874 RepID=UPI002815CEA2|nr:G-type lectin S-receptor-like serine/threonine-protein kinase RLK1 [Lycium ferocissimum]
MEALQHFNAGTVVEWKLKSKPVVAVGMDANGSIFPLAFAIIANESTETCEHQEKKVCMRMELIRREDEGAFHWLNKIDKDKWTLHKDEANRNIPAVPSSAILVLANDGGLIVQVGGKEISIINPSQAIASVSMLDTGNFVLYNSHHNIIWQSFDNPTNNILPGLHLSAGQELFSSASEANDSFGIFRLKIQDDENPFNTEYPEPDIGTYAYFATDTAGVGNNATLNLDDNGHRYLLNSTIGLRNLTKGGYHRERTIIYLMKIDANGIF